MKKYANNLFNTKTLSTACSLLFLLSPVMAYSATVGPGDVFRVWFDLSQYNPWGVSPTGDDIPIHEHLDATLYFSGTNPLQTGDSWESQVFDKQGNALSQPTHFEQFDGETRIVQYYPSVQLDEPRANFQGYIEFTVLKGSFELLEHTRPAVTSWIIDEANNRNLNDKHYRLLSTLEVNKQDGTVPAKPELAVQTIGDLLTINRSFSSEATGTNLYYRKLPNGSKWGKLNLGNKRTAKTRLPVGASYEVYVTSYNSHGESEPSDRASFSITGTDYEHAGQVFPYDVKGLFSVGLEWKEDQYFQSTTEATRDETLGHGGNLLKFALSPYSAAVCTDNDFIATNVTRTYDRMRVIADVMHDAGIQVAMGPFFTVSGSVVGDSSSNCSGRVSPSDPVAWFANYREIVLEQAELAEEIGAEYFVMWSDDLQHLLTDHDLTALWVELTEDVNAVYSGIVTNLLSVNVENASVYPFFVPREIFDGLDMIGIGLFPTLTEYNDPTLEELFLSYYRNSLGLDSTEFMLSLHEYFDKDILMTDKAFHSFDGANINEAVIFNESIPLAVDQQEQKDLYDSFFLWLTAQNWPWFKGVIFSSVYIAAPNENEANLPRHLRLEYGERFTSKLAEESVRDWFGAGD